MIKFFMIRFEIPTRQDIQKVMNRLDQLEKAIKKVAANGKTRQSGSSKTSSNNARLSERNPASNASEIILKAIQDSIDGLDYAGIYEITHFDEKRIRNTLHRLYKAGKIQRRRRGQYVAVD